MLIAKRTPLMFGFAVILVLLFFVPGAVSADDKRVVLLRTPNEGIQPQAVIDTQGVLHLLYFKGRPEEGDLYYVRREPGKNNFSNSVRVNSQLGSAAAVGTIRGGQIALGKGNRVHVAWNGSAKAAPRRPGGADPMLYSRLDDAGTAFEPQRNLMQITTELDGGGTVASDSAGNVYLAWHAATEHGAGEDNRKVWVARSSDDGKTFAREGSVFDEPTGACGCCAMRAFVDRNGAIYLLYRSATEVVKRDTYLLGSKKDGQNFQSILIHPWRVKVCPMSSAAFAESADSVVAAWETDGQIYYAKINPDTLKAEQPHAAPGAKKQRKHPAVALNHRGEMLVVWTEGTGWKRGGALAWQVFDSSGKPVGDIGRVAGAIPVWGFAAAAAEPDGRFTIIY